MYILAQPISVNIGDIGDEFTVSSPHCQFAPVTPLPSKYEASRYYEQNFWRLSISTRDSTE